MKNYQFPKNFWWGSASSATQTEGAAHRDGKGENTWDYWFSKEPYRFHNEIGPETAGGFYDNYTADIKLMKAIGHNSYRTSIAWARLIPNGVGAVNPEAVEFYNGIINEMLANGIEPFINLFHFDLPLAEFAKGGWESREVVEDYALFAKTCFQLFGDRVKYWFSHNEPIINVVCGYLEDYHFPNVVDCQRAMTVMHNLNISTARAVEEYRTLGLDGQIGVILNLSPHYPRSQNPADVRAAKIAELFHSHSFLRPAVKGEYPVELLELLRDHDIMPEMTAADLAIIRNNTVDLLGVNYYMPYRFKAKEYLPHPDSPFKPGHLYDHYEMPGRLMNPYRGWEIHYQGIYDLSLFIRDHYGNIPYFISENGMGVENEERFLKAGMIEDDYRIEFVSRHLKWLHQAIQEGCNCKGYHMWTFIDCWSWCNAYKNRYGFYSLDLETQQRSVKKSGLWYKAVAENNGF